MRMFFLTASGCRLLGILGCVLLLATGCATVKLPEKAVVSFFPTVQSPAILRSLSPWEDVSEKTLWALLEQAGCLDSLRRHGITSGEWALACRALRTRGYVELDMRRCGENLQWASLCHCTGGCGSKVLCRSRYQTTPDLVRFQDFPKEEDGVRRGGVCWKVTRWYQGNLSVERHASFSQGKREYWDVCVVWNLNKTEAKK